jgi:D-beta-D-heptose 7-phosphate kinase/D-beta-D-heptose 1-phosphate adenosyltransferase
MAAGRHVVRLDWEETSPIACDDAKACLEGLSRGGEPKSIVLSDYAKGTLASGLANALISRARALEIPVVVDSKSVDWCCFAGASIMTPSLDDLHRVTREDLRLADPNRVQACARRLLERLDVGALVVTMGRRGMLLVPRTGRAHWLAGRKAHLVDATGAGDAVVASLAAALAAGATLLDAAQLANAAAAVVVGKLGAATATPHEILAFLDAGRPAASDDSTVRAFASGQLKISPS